MTLTSDSVSTTKPKICVIIGATSKWRSDGPNTHLVHETGVADAGFSDDERWGLGGALALKFAREGYFVVLTTRTVSNAEPLLSAIHDVGGTGVAVRLDLRSPESIESTFADIRKSHGEPEVLIFNAGYMSGRDLPPEKELMEFFPSDEFGNAIDIASRAPFLVAKEVLPAMRHRGHGSILFSNNQYSLRGRKRHTGQSLYYPRTMVRALAQALTEEYSEHGVHIANVVIDGFIDSPGTRALPDFEEHPERLISPKAIADGFYYLHTQDPSAWSHELQFTSSATLPSY